MRSTQDPGNVASRLALGLTPAIMWLVGVISAVAKSALARSH